MNDNIGLVLEGGGFRGCYTAGALKWLNDHDIHIKYTVGISAAAAYAFFYAAEQDQASFEVSTSGVKDKEVLGLSPLIREGGVVGYDYLRSAYYMPYYKEALDFLRSTDREVEIGMFDMDHGQLRYFGKDVFDDEAQYIKASCVLPLTNKMNVFDGIHYLDGGIRTMISLERARETGHDKNLVIVTKDKNYVRKPNGWALTTLLKIVYRKYPLMLKTLDSRVETYYHEMDMVYQGEEDGNTILIRPTRDPGVTRFSGSKEQMLDMYNLGYQDMEDRKEEILKFLEVE